MHSAPPVPGAAAEPSAAVRRVRTAMSELTAPSDSRISPDGRGVAVTVLGPWGADVVIAPADGPELPLPTGPSDPAGRTRHTPRWLPDSRTVLLVTEPVEPGPPVLTAWDTRTGDRRELAVVPGAVEELYVSDDGTEVLVLAADDGAERDGMNLGLPVRLGPAPAPVSHRPDAGRRRLLHAPLRPADGVDGSVLPAPVALRDAGPAALTVWNAAWRGGRTVVATVSDDPLPAGYYHARLVRIDLADGRTVPLHRPRGQLAAPALSPDGRRAAVCEGISIVAGRPLLVDLDGRAATVAEVPGAEDVTWTGFHPRDGDRLLTAGWSGTGSRVAEIRGGAPAVLHEERAVLSGAGAQPALSLSADGLRAATVREAPGEPPRAVVAATSGPGAWNWRPVTAPDPSAARREAGHGDLARVRTRETAWTAADGTPVHGLLLDAPGTEPATGPGTDPAAGSDTEPATGPGTDPAAGSDTEPATGPGTDPAAGPDTEPATTPGARPLAVLLHGGPSWQWSAGYAPADVLGLAPALAAAGWLVLLPNPRGSSGYGLDHARAVVGACGDVDLDDVLSGVAHLVARGEALPGRSAVLGHSYGGFLAALAAARTDAFRAAVVVSAPTDWLSFAHTSVIGGGYEETYAIGDARTPEGRTALLARSPLFAEGAGTAAPVLVLHGEHDRITPPGQAHELYRALARRATAPVELHVYPAEGHEFTDPAHLLDATARAERWLARYAASGAAAHHGTKDTP